MESGTWVRVVTYDFVMGIPTWAERELSHVGDSDGYHEFCPEPNTILYLAPEMAEDLIRKHAVHLPGEREEYVPVLERVKHEQPEEKPRRRRRRSDAGRERESTRIIRLIG